MSNQQVDCPQVELGDAAGKEPVPRFPHANAVAVKAIAGVLASTLGPASLDKLVVRKVATREDAGAGDVAVDDFVATSDGATILEKLPLEHPIAPVVKRMVGPERPGDTDVEGEDVPDGVTTSVVLAAALLDEATDLLAEGVLPHDVIHGYHRAGELAEAELAAVARHLDDFDDPRAAAEAVARTAMTGNDVGGYSHKWTNISVDAADAVGFPTEKTLVVRRIRDDSIGDSRLVRGAVLDRNARATDAMPRRIEDASVLVLGGHDRGGLRPPETPEEIKATVDSTNDLEAYDEVFDNWRRDVFERILEKDVDVVVTELGIDGHFRDMLGSHGILGVRGVNRLDLAQVALATGANIVIDPTDVSAEYLGYADTVEERIIESYEGRRKRRRMMVFDGCLDPKSVCVLLRGVDDYVGAQATTMIRQATWAVATAWGHHGRRSGVIPGGGCTEAYLAGSIRNASTTEGSRTSLAMEAFANALEQVPFTLAKNGGADPIDVVADLRVANRDTPEEGFLCPAGELGNPVEAGVLDPVALRVDGIRTATAVANLLLRIDDAIDAEFSDEAPDPGEAIYENEAELHAEYLEEN